MATGITREDVKLVVDATFKVIRDEVMMGNQVKILRFGIFKPYWMKSSMRAYLAGKKDNKTRFMAPEKIKPVFKPTRTFKRLYGITAPD